MEYFYKHVMTSHLFDGKSISVNCDPQRLTPRPNLLNSVYWVDK